MNNERVISIDGKMTRVTGDPVYEMGEFIHWLLYHAAGEDAGNPDDAWDMKLTKLEFAHHCADALEDLGWADCLWCGVDTAEIGEFYMVRDEIWETYGPKKGEGMLCIGCLEQRMGRQLTREDFNEWSLSREHVSDRLAARMTQMVLPFDRS